MQIDNRHTGTLVSSLEI